MSKVIKSPKIIQRCLLIALLPFSSQMVLANGIALTGDTVTISASAGGFNQAKNLVTTPGTIPNTDNIPTASITSNLTFTFNVAAATGKTIAAGTYTFNAGMFIDQDATSRRLEMSVPGISLTFDASGNITSGSIAAGSNVKVSGRSSDGSVTAVVTLTNTLLSISDSTFSITAGAQINEIQTSPNVILQDLTTTFTAAASYDYAVFLNQLTGADLTFGLTNGSTYFGCPSTNPMLLTGQTDFSGASALVGRMGIGQAAGGAPTAYSGTCTVVSSGGGGSSTPQAAASALATTAAADTNSLLNSSTILPPAAILPGMNILVANTTLAVTDILNGLSAGTVSADTATNFISTLGKQIQIVSAITAKGGEVPASTVKTILNNTARLMGALKGKTIGASDILLLETALTGTISDIGALFASLRGKFGFLTAYDDLVSYDAINLDTSIADITTVVTELETVINNSLEVPGIRLKSSLFAELQVVSQNAIELLLKPVGTSLGLSIAHNSNTATQALLAQNTTLLGKLLDSVAINVGNSTQITAATAQSALTAAGLSSTFATSLSNDLTAYVKPDVLSVDTGAGATTVSSRLQTALSATSLSVNQTTGVITYSTATESYTTHLLAVLPAAATFPTSALVLPDGSRFIVHNSLAFILAPAISDVTGFAAAINTVGAGTFSTSLRADGTIALNETASNIKFVSSITSFANTSATGTGSTTFTAPTGNPAASSYVFTVQHADGTRQTLVPVIADMAFIQSVGSYGFKITLDRATGVVQIGSFRFRPDYFQTPLTNADALFLNSAKDSSGVAYRPVNANGDGIGDYQVVTSTGVQTFYGLQ